MERSKTVLLAGEDNKLSSLQDEMPESFRNRHLATKQILIHITDEFKINIIFYLF